MTTIVLVIMTPTDFIKVTIYFLQLVRQDLGVWLLSDASGGTINWNASNFGISDYAYLLLVILVL